MTYTVSSGTLNSTIPYILSLLLFIIIVSFNKIIQSNCIDCVELSSLQIHQTKKQYL